MRCECDVDRSHRLEGELKTYEALWTYKIRILQPRSGVIVTILRQLLLIKKVVLPLAKRRSTDADDVHGSTTERQVILKHFPTCGARILRQFSQVSNKTITASATSYCTNTLSTPPGRNMLSALRMTFPTCLQQVKGMDTTQAVPAPVQELLPPRLFPTAAFSSIHSIRPPQSRHQCFTPYPLKGLSPAFGSWSGPSSVVFAAHIIPCRT